MVGIVLLGVFVLLLAFGAPIAVCLGMSSVGAILVQGAGKPLDAIMSVLPRLCSSASSKFVLLAIPFFILSGNVMEKAGISGRLINLAEKCLGHIRGGMAMVCVVVSCFFAAISGSGPATVAALGLILIPGMARAGYDKAFAAATVSVTSGLAIVIPPSIAFIVYGSVADVSVPALFAAGFVPGIVVALFIMAAVLIISRKRGYRGQPSGKSVGTALKEAFWGVMTPVVILGGIYGGVFTPTEAAAVAVFYGLFVGVFIYRTINSISILVEIFAASIRATAVVMLVVTCAGLFSWVASTVGLVEKGSAVLLAVSDNQWVVLLMINIILLLAGMLLDAISIYYVFLPFMLPIMAHFNWDPVWFGIMMTVNLAVGQVTPPVAVNLYVGANISGISMERISKAALPLIFASLLALVVIIMNLGLIPQVFGRIFAGAFDFQAIFAGFTGSAVMQGVKRGLFSNEAGVGSAPNAAASANVSHPVKQGLVQMLSVFLDTLVICSATAFMLLCSGVEPAVELQGAPYVQSALAASFGTLGPVFITVAMVLFAFTTLIGNLYYVDNALAYLLGHVPSKRFMVVFRLIAMGLIFLGAGFTLDLVWNLSDVLMGVMVLINIPVIAVLSRPAAAALRNYTEQRRAGKNPVFRAADIDLKEKTEYWN